MASVRRRGRRDALQSIAAGCFVQRRNDERAAFDRAHQQVVGSSPGIAEERLSHDDGLDIGFEDEGRAELLEDDHRLDAAPAEAPGTRRQRRAEQAEILGIGPPHVRSPAAIDEARCAVAEAIVPRQKTGQGFLQEALLISQIELHHRP